MVVIYIPIEQGNRYTLEQQSEFMNEMMQKGWKHLGYTMFKNPIEENVPVAILFADFLWTEECKGIEKPEIKKEDGSDTGTEPKYVHRAVIIKVPICPKCGLQLEEEKDPDARAMYHFKCPCGYTH